MTTSKNTKKALLASVLSIIVCMAMLIGSTFAWFTDNVTSGKNKIVAGNLDIQLNYKNAKMAADGEYFAEVLPTTENLFVNSEGNDIRWEPGAAAVTYLELKNAGNLALKYVLSVDAKDTVVGEDGAALSKVLKTAVVEITEAEVGTYDRAKAVQKAEAADAESILGYNKPGEMTEQGQVKYLAMIVYFPEEIGNIYDDAVYNRSDVELKTELSLNLVATQMPHEKDSFGENYDKKAAYPAVNPAGLSTALSNGGMVVLGSNVTVPVTGTGTGVVPQMVVTKDTVLNLSGKTLSVNYNGELSYVPALISVESGTLTINGNNGVLNAEAGENSSYGINVNGGKLVINGGNYYGAMSAVQVQKGALEINGGFFDMAPTCKAMVPQYANYIINCIDRYYVSGEATISIKGGTFVNFDPSANPEGANTSYVADNYQVVSEVQENGDIWYTVVAK